MAPLPRPFSIKEQRIRAALSQGRLEDAKTAVIELLRAGKASRSIQSIAADMLRPEARKRGRQKADPQHWYDIADMFNLLRSEGISYESAMVKVAEKFGYSETHVRNSITLHEKARDEHEEATRK
jgi:hypothetical protein